MTLLVLLFCGICGRLRKYKARSTSSRHYIAQHPKQQQQQLWEEGRDLVKHVSAHRHQIAIQNTNLPGMYKNLQKFARKINPGVSATLPAHPPMVMLSSLRYDRPVGFSFIAFILALTLMPAAVTALRSSESTSACDNSHVELQSALLSTVVYMYISNLKSQFHKTNKPVALFFTPATVQFSVVFVLIFL